MELTIHAKGENAKNLSYFLGKHPDHPFERTSKYGKVECKFLAYSEEEAKVYFTFQPDGLALVKNSHFHRLEDYISDREFSLSTIFLSHIRTSVGYVFSGGKEGMDEPFDFTVSLSPLSTKLPDQVLEELFSPLGFAVKISKIESDFTFAINSGRVVSLTLQGRTDISSLFRQLFVLIPVIDNYKHHFIDQTEVDKLLRYGDGWLEQHPLKSMITQRFVRYRKTLANNVLETLASKINEPEVEVVEPETKTPLGKLRYSKFAEIIQSLDVTSVVDMGAGEGRLLELLVQNEQLQTIYACEPTLRGIERMHQQMERLHQKNKVKVEPTIVQSSLFYEDDRLKNQDALVLCEVMEHIERERIDPVFHTILSIYQPKHFLFSTPNYEYNDVYGLNGKFRHADHRFEMTRAEFHAFASTHAERHGYYVTFIGIGEEHADFGFPTQLAILTKLTEEG